MKEQLDDIMKKLNAQDRGRVRGDAQGAGPDPRGRQEAAPRAAHGPAGHRAARSPSASRSPSRRSTSTSTPTARSSRPASPSRRGTSCSCPRPASGRGGLGGGAAAGRRGLRRSCWRGRTSPSWPRSTRRIASGKDGGSLGTLKRGELAPDIEKPILRLSPGEISPPFRSAGRLPPLPARLARRRSRARRWPRPAARSATSSTAQKYDARLKDWLAEIKQRAIIDIRL